jgi:hypothetical protein
MRRRASLERGLANVERLENQPATWAAGNPADFPGLKFHAVCRAFFLFFK